MIKLKEKFISLYHKMVGENATPEYIARGWAIGMFWGCICPFGLQLIFSIPTSFILKGSKIGATLGTFITNHFSIFVIYPLQCYIGSLILANGLTYSSIKAAMGKVINEQSYSALLECGTDLLMSFFAGGVILTLIMTPITYFGVKFIVKAYRQRKMKEKIAGQ